jgi:hypothetical protein
VQFFGDISYSLYLLHFVILTTAIFSQPRLPGRLPSIISVTAKEKVLIFFICTVISFLMFVFIEKLMRRLKLKLTYLTVLVTIVVSVGLSSLMMHTANSIVVDDMQTLRHKAWDAVSESAKLDAGDTDINLEALCFGAVAAEYIDVCGGDSDVWGKSSDISERTHQYDNFQQKDLIQVECKENDEKQITGCTHIGDVESDTKVIVYGSSHAAMIASALDAIGKEKHWDIEMVVRFSCPVEYTEEVRQVKSWNVGTCAPLMDYFLSKAKTAKYAFIAAYYASAVVDEAVPQHLVIRDAEELVKDYPNVYFFADSPSLAFADNPAGETWPMSSLHSMEDIYFPSIKDRMISVKDAYCDRSSICYRSIGGLLWSNDTVSHINTTYSITLIPRYLHALRDF